MARRADHSREELKELILNAAWDIIGREGFENMTARRIASDIGYAPGTIYNLFESMDEIHLQINGRTLDALYKVLMSKKCNDPSKPIVQNVKMMAALYGEFSKKYNSYWLMLFNHSLPEGRQELAWYQEKIDLLFSPLENLLMPIFSAGQGQKRKIAARALWASVHGLCFLQQTGKIPLIGGKAVAAEEMSSYLIDSFIEGIEKSVK